MIELIFKCRKILNRSDNMQDFLLFTQLVMNITWKLFKLLFVAVTEACLVIFLNYKMMQEENCMVFFYGDLAVICMIVVSVSLL